MEEWCRYLDQPSPPPQQRSADHSDHSTPPNQVIPLPVQPPLSVVLFPAPIPFPTPSRLQTVPCISFVVVVPHRSISPPHRSTSSPRSNRLPSHRSMRRSSDTWIFVDCAVTIAKDPSTRNTSVDVFFVSCVNTTEEQPSVSNVSTAASARTTA